MQGEHTVSNYFIDHYYNSKNFREKIKKLLLKANELPQISGCYLFKDTEGNILYVGKAKNLKNRVCSYFQESQMNSHSVKTLKLLSVMEDFDFVITSNESNALILENDLIKRHIPKYNIRLKDDKSYPYVMIDLREPFPRICFVRENELVNEVTRVIYGVIQELIEDKKLLLFGPFVESRSLKEVLRILNKNFQLRACGHHTFISRKTACVLYQMNYCSAPCVGEIGNARYRQNLFNAIKFFQGKKSLSQIVLKVLKKKMLILSEKEEYEKAIEIREEILKLEQFLKYSLTATTIFKEDKDKDKDKDTSLIQLKNLLGLKEVPLQIECYDVAVWQGGSPTGAKVVMKDGKLDKNQYRYYHLNSREEGNNDYEMLKELICRRFSFKPKSDQSNISNNNVNSKDFDLIIPDLIVIDGGKGQLNCVKSILNEHNIDVMVIGIAKRNKNYSCDRLVVANDEKKIYQLDKYPGIWSMLAKLRDEAHRFCRKLHHKKEKKRSLVSFLDDIEGIGEKGKKKILMEMDVKNISIEMLNEISEEEMANKLNITLKMATKIKQKSKTKKKPTLV